jgi:tRNA dimethylallyltransferase
VSDARWPAILLLGPTAAGKSDLALELVARLPCEIISVDSAMIYRGMDIGTAKPTADELLRAPHHLIDIRDPAESYSAAEFVADATAAMTAIRQQGRIPLLVGGTMLYYRALTHGLARLPSADTHLRQQIEAEAAERGWAALHRELANVDPVAAARIHPNDPQRLQRAIEVWRLTGQPLSAHWQQGAEAPAAWRYLWLGLAPDERARLHQRIAERFDQMLANGLIDEVEQLWRRGDLSAELPSIRCVGYRQVWRYLAGETDRATLRETGIAATRQLAKRQLTWMRSMQELHWLAAENDQRLNRCLKLLAENSIVATSADYTAS